MTYEIITVVVTFLSPHSDLYFIVPDLPRLFQEVLRQQLTILQELILAPIINQHVDRILLALAPRNKFRGVVSHLTLLNAPLEITIECLDTPWGYTRVRGGRERRDGSILFRLRVISEPQ